MLTFVQTLTNAVYALLGISVLVGVACLVYFLRGKKVGTIDAKAAVDLLRIKEAEKNGDGAALKKEILDRLKGVK